MVVWVLGLSWVFYLGVAVSDGRPEGRGKTLDPVNAVYLMGSVGDLASNVRNVSEIQTSGEKHGWRPSSLASEKTLLHSRLTDDNDLLLLFLSSTVLSPFYTACHCLYYSGMQRYLSGVLTTGTWARVAFAIPLRHLSASKKTCVVLTMPCPFGLRKNPYCNFSENRNCPCLRVYKPPCRALA